MSENEEMCELLIEYFLSVFTIENTADELPEVKYLFNKDKSHMLSNILLSQDIMSTKLSKLRVSKAFGVEGIVPILLTEISDLLSIPLLHTYKKIGRVPIDWSKANVSVRTPAILHVHCTTGGTHPVVWSNGLALNPAKSEAVQFSVGRGRSHTDGVTAVDVFNAEIKPAATINILDQHLSFNQQVDGVCKSCYCRIQAKRRVRLSL